MCESNAASESSSTDSPQRVVDEPGAERELEVLFQLSLDLLCIASGDGYFKRVNPAFERTLGYSTQELLSRPFFDFIHPEDRERTRDELRKLASGMPTIHFENRHIRRDGSQRWLSWTAVPADHGERIYAVAVDVTDRKRSEERFRQLVEFAPDGLVLVDPAGRIVLVNVQLERMTGYTREELLGQPVELLAPERFRNQHEQDRKAYAASPHTRLMGEHRALCCRRKDGSQFPAEISLSPMDTEEGTLICAAVRDVTRQRASDERFTLAVRGTDLGIWDWDLRSCTVYFSPRWKSMLGYAEDEICGDFSEWEGRLHPEDRQHAIATLHDYLEGRSPDYELKHRLRHKDGTYRWILARGATVRDADGVPYRMVGSHLDITALRLAEARAQEHDEQFLAAQRIQEHLLPRQSPVVSGFDIAGASYTAEFAGGDHFDYLPMRGGYLGLSIGDVAGHGFASALLMGCMHGYVRSLVETSDDVGEILTIANRILVEEIEGDRFITFLLGRLDRTTGSFMYCNAGHPAGYVLDAEGNITSSLESTAAPLGMFKEEEYVSAGPVLLQPGDLLLLITDGVIEARSPEEEQFGTERLLHVVRSHRHKTSREIIDHLYQAVIDFSQTEKPLDDVTAVVVRVESGVTA